MSELDQLHQNDPNWQALPEHLKNPVYPRMDMPTPPQGSPEGARPDGEGIMEAANDAANSPVPPPPPGKARILIGMPLLDVKYEQFESFLKLWTELCLKPDPRYEVGYTFAYRKPVHMAEESLVNIARYNKATHILFMDDDIYDVTKADLDKLFEADKDCISGVMHASKFPHAMCVFRRFDRNKKVIDMPADNSMYRLYEIPCTCPHCNTALSHWDMKHCFNCGNKVDLMVQQADLTPLPFTLIKMEVFNKIKKPWFHCTNGYPTDSWLADRLIEAGMTMHAHMGVRLNHAGITDETKPYYVQMGMARAQKLRAVVELSPQQMELHQSLLSRKMWETEQSLKPKIPFAGTGGLVAGELKKDLTLLTHGT